MADRLPFGKTIAEFNEEQSKTATLEPEVKTEPTITDATKVETPPAKVEPTKEIKTEPKPVDWLGEFNKINKTEFKTPDEIGAVFQKAKKVDEYEPKISEYEKQVKKYQQDLETAQSSLNPLQYFSSQDAFVAEQLRKQRPDLSPAILQDVVLQDNTRMSDLDVLVKNQMLITPGLIGGENGAREYILDKYGIDTTIPQEEWSITTKNKILIEANATRRTWNELKSGVKLPEVATPEAREAIRVQQVEQKKQQLTPLKETFSKFDKFTEEIEEGKVFEFNVPDEYKSQLGDIFDAYFVDSGLEPTKENLETIENLKKAMLISGNFKQIYKTIEGDVETRMKAERDKLLNNTTPLNTKSAAELETDENAKLSNTQGFGKLFGKK